MWVTLHPCSSALAKMRSIGPPASTTKASRFGPAATRYVLESQESVMARSTIMVGTVPSRRHGTHPYLLPDRGHRPLHGLLRSAGLRGAPPDADPRRGHQRLHGPARRRRPARADLQPRRRLLRARHGLQPHRAHRRRHRGHADAARRAGHRAREAALPGARGRLADRLRARSGRLPDRAHRTLVTESRLAVIDCGSNSFRLVVFTFTDTWWKRTDEIYEAVRVGEGLEATGELQ